MGGKLKTYDPSERGVVTTTSSVVLYTRAHAEVPKTNEPSAALFFSRTLW